MNSAMLQLPEVNEAMNALTLWLLFVTIKYPKARVEQALERDSSGWRCLLRLTGEDKKPLYEGAAHAPSPVEAIQGAMLMATINSGQEALAINNALLTDNQPRGLLGNVLGISRA